MSPSAVSAPAEVTSKRLVMRAADPDFAADVVSVIQESIQDLSPWLLWAQQVPTLEEEEEILRSSLERFQAREEFRYYLFERFGARRVQIRMSTRNERSAKIPERLGFQLEGVLRNDSLHADGSPRDTKVYARLAPSST